MRENRLIDFIKIRRSPVTNFSSAFTIVELLVIIVIISILATITFVSYTGISRQATIAAISSDLDNAFKKFKLFQVENSGYPTGIELNCTSPVTSTNICLKPNANDQYTLAYTDNSTPSNQTFCLNILNTAINATYHVSNDGSQAAGVCPTYALTNIAGIGGTVSASGAYNPGSIQTITATPDLYHLFGSWTGSTGCAGAVSHTITMDADKTCTANFTLSPNWYAGVASTPMAGKYIRINDLSMNQFKTTNTAVVAPQGVLGLDPSYPDNMFLVNPQTNPGVDFSAYPAQNACKAIGGRLPTPVELIAMYTNRASYGNNFVSDTYWSSMDSLSTGYASYVIMNNGSLGDYLETSSYRVRCVAG